MGVATSLPSAARAPGQRSLRAALLLSVAALLGVGLSAAVLRHPPGLMTVLVVGLALGAAVALTLTRYDVAVALGFVLMAIVKFEPAPPDGLFAVIVLVAVVTGRFDVARAPLVIVVAIGSFLVLNIVSWVDAVDTARAAFFFLVTLYLCIFALWFTGYLRSAERARLVIRAYVAASVVSALLGSLSLLTGVGSDLLTAYDQTRASGLFKDPNVYGPFLVPAALIVLEESMRRRLLSSGLLVKRLLFVVLLIGILFSYSRAAWLNVVVGTVVMLLVLSVRRRSGRSALGLLLVIVLAAVGIAGMVVFTESASFLQDRAQVQTYDSARFDAQRRGVRFGEEYPVGIGPGQFEVRAPLASHSTYVRVLAEQGLGGALAIVVVLLATLVFAVRNAALGRDTYGIGSAALLGAWCGILANSLVVDTLHWRHLWFVAAMIWAGTAAARLGAGGRGPRL